MTDLTVFNYESKEVRTVMVDGEPWFVAKDVCDLLDVFWNGEDTLIKIPSEWKGVVKLHTPGGVQSVYALRESAVYKLAFRSNKKEADDFTNKVADYIKRLRNKELSKIEILRMAMESEEGRLAEKAEKERLLIENKEMKPKAAFADDFQAAKGDILVRQMAKKLGGTGEHRLFDWLRLGKILMGNNEPYQRYMDAGYFRLKSVVKDVNGKKTCYHTTMVTQKGQYWIWECWNEARGQLVLKIANQ